VYVELLGGRQPGLDFALPETAVVAASRERRAPRPHAPTDAERAAHEEMLALLTAPLWRTEA
ncbi:MAG: DNA polymerase III subunit epsilon, partial [Stellaceae bacterium]